MKTDAFGNMQVMCDAVPVCEFKQLDQPELLSTAPGFEFPAMPPRPVTIKFSMPRKSARRMRADFKQRDAVVWRLIARKYGWTTKRLRRMKKCNKCGNASLWLALEVLDRFAESFDS